MELFPVKLNPVTLSFLDSTFSFEELFGAELKLLLLLLEWLLLSQLPPLPQAAKATDNAVNNKVCFTFIVDSS